MRRNPCPDLNNNRREEPRMPKNFTNITRRDADVPEEQSRRDGGGGGDTAVRSPSRRPRSSISTSARVPPQSRIKDANPPGVSTANPFFYIRARVPRHRRYTENCFSSHLPLLSLLASPLGPSDSDSCSSSGSYFLFRMPGLRFSLPSSIKEAGQGIVADSPRGDEKTLFKEVPVQNERQVDLLEIARKKNSSSSLTGARIIISNTKRR